MRIIQNRILPLFKKESTSGITSSAAGAKKGHSEKNKYERFTSEIKDSVEYWIKQEYSPEQIVGRANDQGIDCVSHKRIYQHIWDDKKMVEIYTFHYAFRGTFIEKRGASKDKRSQIIGRIDIDQRPKSVEERKIIGDLEIDLMIGAGHKGALLTINDRATGG